MWKPSVTVAGVVERDGRFLFVEEEADGRVVINQPAGHLDPNESLLRAVSREVLEETRYRFTPTALVGVYLWPHQTKDISYLRFAFSGEITGEDKERDLDTGILRTLWLTPEELQRESDRHRSPLVSRCVADYLAGQRYPLDMLASYFE
jgi:8-oxo-dGTP pyrophosphatase MutT (NUDIX family)